jgi:hypothetical protein
MSYSHAQSVDEVLRLGLRARLGAVREARMTSAAARRRLAESFERAVARADRRSVFSAAVPVCREAAGDARSALLDLAERLRAPRPVDPAGVRLARSLLVDGGGPLYVTERPGQLRAAAMRTLGALDGHGAGS